MAAVSTREQIVEIADDLFYRGGFEATSFADIAADIGISRGNFYYYFKTKDEILDAVIDRRLQRTSAMLDGWESQAPEPRERIVAFIELLIANRAPIMAYGCPVGTLCAELAKLDHVHRERAAEIFGLFARWLEKQFRALGADETARAWALHVLAWSQGVASLATAFKDEAFIRREVADIICWLDDRIVSLSQ
ncbi:TetR/AcrR family transcriptional regulator [Nitratireductor sp. L15S-10]|uniref:TetR/AcrR family transcriptional regulator n=1 Tax=Nitratireductor sp. L15S-10 TaxID=3034028 RepID=UPI0038575DBC